MTISSPSKSTEDVEDRLASLASLHQICCHTQMTTNLLIQTSMQCTQGVLAAFLGVLPRYLQALPCCQFCILSMIVPSNVSNFLWSVLPPFKSIHLVQTWVTCQVHSHIDKLNQTLSVQVARVQWANIGSLCQYFCSVQLTFFMSVISLLSKVKMPICNICTTICLIKPIWLQSETSHLQSISWLFSICYLHSPLCTKLNLLPQ